ncbi:hypothetical protein MMYC01_202251 [Madurella mycetomatis]|uniref:Uncharacterized protein n=1 Tax=Madurella mycetomatis TaxID=100816 RepID=A0A175W9Z1_9PEZI|nr:hypothetical protein MMYC01_202251 [Madurella mycetomatis]
MAPSTAVATNATPTSPNPPATAASCFSSQRSSLAPLIIACPFPGCSAKIDGREGLCQTHLQTVSQTSRSQDVAQTNGALPTPAPSGSPSSARQLSDSSLRSKKLLEIGKDRPIMMRKTAENGKAPHFIPQQPAPKHNTPPSRGESTMSSPSSKPLAPRSSVQSLPTSPGHLQNGEPARKRQRLSPSPGRSPRTRVNGTGPSRPSTAETDSGGKAPKVSIPRLDRQASTNSLQRMARSPEKRAKPGFKPSATMRIAPTQLTTVRFIGCSEEDYIPRSSPDQANPGVNGSAESVSHRNRGGLASSFSLNEGIKDYWTGKINNSVPPVARAESPSSGSSRETPRIPDLPNGHSQTFPPGRRTEAQITSNDTRSEPSTQAIHFPIRPAPVPATKPPPSPSSTRTTSTPKEINTSIFDALIYSQPLASTPPPDVHISLAALTTQPQHQQNQQHPTKKEPEDEPLYLEIDPRVHWPQHHSSTWLSRKQREIEARGRRKANFGRAAHSLRAQLQTANGQGLAFEDTLPEKIAENPVWVRALRRLRGLGLPGDDDTRETSGSGNASSSGSGGEGVGVGVQRRGGRGGKR